MNRLKKDRSKDGRKNWVEVKLGSFIILPGKFQTRHEPENGRLLPGQVYVLPSKKKQNPFN